MTQLSGRWMPSADVRSHSGGPIPPGTLFFAPPPPEIGRIVSAHSGLREAGCAVSKPVPRKVIGLFVLFGVAVGGFLGAGFSQGHWLGILIGAPLGALLIGVPICRRERKRDDCTYVGTHGTARFPVSGRGRSVPKGEIFLFANAVDLQTALLGRSAGTNFNYQWKNEKGKTVYKLEGGYYGNNKSIDPDAVFHFAQAAEEAWSQYYLPQVRADLQRKGSYQFITRRGLSANQVAVIAPGRLEVITGEKRFHAAAHDIDDIVVHHGWIIIRRKDAQNRAMQSLDGAHGILYLSYGTVSNAKIFLTLLTQVVGVAWRNGE
jgi:hypothetical protein